MGVINVSASDKEATVVISDKGSSYSASTSITLLNLNDISLTNTQGTFRYSCLDTQSEKVVTTVATNSVALNLVIDEDQFFGTDAAGETSPIIKNGLFGQSNAKVEVDFRIYFEKIDIALHCHFILPKNSLNDFIFRCKLPTSEHSSLENHQSFWDYLDSLTKK